MPLVETDSEGKCMPYNTAQTISPIRITETEQKILEQYAHIGLWIWILNLR